MEIDLWLEWYSRILGDFKFDEEDDIKAAEYLNDFLKNEGSIGPDDLKPPSKNFIVFGAGPSLKRHIRKFKSLKIDLTVISADGATTALLEEGVIPHIIVTDLDGKMEDILKANKLGSYVVVHAHGHNLEKLKKYLPLLKNVIGTTQGRPFGVLNNFGGFTDGDRAVFLAVALGAKKIILAGMDFGETITKYSRPDIKVKVKKADPVKRLKLEYAERLIKWVSVNRNVKIKNWSLHNEVAGL